MQGPSAIAVDERGSLCIFDNANMRLVKYSSQSKYLKSIKQSICDAMAFDDKGYLYVDSGSGYIDVFDTELKHLRTLKHDGEEGAPPHRMWLRRMAGKVYIYHVDPERTLILPCPAFSQKSNVAKPEYVKAGIFIGRTSFSQTQAVDGWHIKANIPLPMTQTFGSYAFDAACAPDRIELLGQAGGAVFLGQEFYDNKPGPSKAIVIIPPNGHALDGPLLDRNDYLAFDQQYCLALTEDGSIYHLWIRKQEPIVVKWVRRG